MKVSNDEYRKIAVVIVTYNPDLKTLREILTHLDNKFTVVISDNNSDNFNKIREVIVNYKNLIILKHSENLGIATAQNDAIRFLFSKEKGISYICFLDQDSILDNTDLIELFYCLKGLENEKVAVIGPNYQGSRARNLGMISERELISSGSLISKKAFMEVGLFLEQLFIDFVDYEWCWRARKKGFKVYMDSSIYLKHQVGINDKNKRFNKIIITPKRLYFVYRNYLYLLKTDRTIKVENKIWIVNLFKQFIFNVFFCPQKLIRLRYILKGCKDSLKLCKDDKFENIY